MTTGNDEEEDPSEVSPCRLDEVFGLLAAKRRRHALYYLERRDDDCAEIDEVVAFVVNHGRGGNEEVAIDLRHNHLPHLERAGVAEFDARSGTIRYHPDELLEAWLGRAAEHDGV